ncbi:MAG: ATP phosphoribosyltransferase [Helicobacter sp.]|uniref:ATP phosphoribosyltransferase n=1 Tax=Helicobacter sp. 10-6591 TaxID=2004998 RepID=UPI000DCD5EA1|nr:ATP phosphoribosyltransferase [Helicobacter sp. 10-6591]MCI6218046.1 ATP phosphoribosyltransferase [Helicobacter sp.]MCI7485324.1 ATP phosphoribosyltransferase [Helicobacter sp.]MDD7567049.1 ATP phosphoribosyltransferase [Helicobacter sp.]MDY5740755.1 ATP phosphoribosyltransferase [Helicobacter sp.]RAX54531.1 ATP phosphoribosyltransferase [Helicobacter sp. 10-6591]
MIRIALPKGRIAKESLELFSRVFSQDFNFEDRKLILDKDNLRFLLVRSQDVLTYVHYQAADVGVVGLDVIEEFDENSVLKLLDLHIGKCKVIIGSPVGRDIDYQKTQIKIATKMPTITHKYFSKKAIPLEIIKLYGSIELAPLVGLSDGIVDIVETGVTMKQNNLKIDEVIMESSAYLVANHNSFYQKQKEILDLMQSLSEKLHR